MPTMFSSLEYVRAMNANTGGHWFSAGAMRFFGTRLNHTLYGGRVFVASHLPPSADRFYAVHIASRTEDGRVVIDTIGDLSDWFGTSRSVAHRVARDIGRVADSLPEDLDYDIRKKLFDAHRHV